MAKKAAIAGQISHNGYLVRLVAAREKPWRKAEAPKAMKYRRISAVNGGGEMAQRRKRKAYHALSAWRNWRRNGVA